MYLEVNTCGGGTLSSKILRAATRQQRNDAANRSSNLTRTAAALLQVQPSNRGLVLHLPASASEGRFLALDGRRRLAEASQKVCWHSVSAESWAPQMSSETKMSWK